MKECECELMPDECLCQSCKKRDNCLERRRVEAMDDIVIDCLDFEEARMHAHAKF